MRSPVQSRSIETPCRIRRHGEVVAGSGTLGGMKSVILEIGLGIGLGLCLVAGGCATSSRVEARPEVVIEMETSAGTITLELDRAHAPISVANFLDHARKGHYEGTVFHRVIPTFVIQGGGWTPQLVEKAKLDAAAGRPDVPIRNEWQNGLKNAKYTIAMARDAAPDTATREFYINVADNAKLDGPREVTGNAGYAVFGRVIGGFEAVEKIRTGATGPRKDVAVDDGGMENVPLELVEIRHMRVR